MRHAGYRSPVADPCPASRRAVPSPTAGACSLRLLIWWVVFPTDGRCSPARSASPGSATKGRKSASPRRPESREPAPGSALATLRTAPPGGRAGREPPDGSAQPVLHRHDRAPAQAAARERDVRAPHRRIVGRRLAGPGARAGDAPGRPSLSVRRGKGTKTGWRPPLSSRSRKARKSCRSWTRTSRSSSSGTAVLSTAWEGRRGRPGQGRRHRPG